MDDDKNKLLLQHQDIQISDETNKQLNQPLKTIEHEEVQPEDQQFLTLLIKKIEAGEIKLLEPSSLLNHAVYDKLDELAQGKADYDAVNLLADIREIHRLWQNGERDTYQIIYLVHKMRLTKERLEQLGGDIYII